MPDSNQNLDTWAYQRLMHTEAIDMAAQAAIAKFEEKSGAPVIISKDNRQLLKFAMAITAAIITEHYENG